jgi:DNA-binding transcriptional ArsR family regulator
VSSAAGPAPSPGRDTGTEALFAALADPTRRAILDWLAEGGPATSTELARRLPMTRQAVAKHLASLEAAGLVRSERVGREVRHRLDPEPLSKAMRWMSLLAARWDERLRLLRDLLEQRQESG